MEEIGSAKIKVFGVGVSEKELAAWAQSYVR